MFDGGETTALLLAEAQDNFQDKTKALASALSDGEFTMDDFEAIGELVVAGLAVEGAKILKGVTDVVAAIGGFFNNVANAIENGWKALTSVSVNSGLMHDWRMPLD